MIWLKKSWPWLAGGLVSLVAVIGIWLAWSHLFGVEVAPTLTLTARANPVQPDQWIVVTATTNGKHVRWSVAEAGLKPLPPFTSVPPKTFAALVPATGYAQSYHITAITAHKDAISEPVTIEIRVGDAPVPPGPTPPPTDPLTQALTTAYAQETDPAKAAQVKFLAAIYAGAPALLTADVTTVGALFTKLSSAIHAPGVGIPQGSLPKITRVVGTALNESQGGDASGVPVANPLQADKAKAAFAKIAAALGGLK